ncbi:Golgi apparatus membrane protein tvp18 [Basidiobolus ranarum]|uniref:Golgi apparatus membrane protein tvp18 n=1 Tax=Basidiobolus ranarum TaxID=34480 RepID=A0ABR2VTS5_9FUNG
MSISDEFRSGNFSIYGQWTAIIAAICLIVFGIIKFTSVVVFAIFGFIFAACILILEIPFCTAVIPKSSVVTDRFSSNLMRAILYLIFAIVIWASIAQRFTVLFLGALFLTFSIFFYAIAHFRGQDRASSTLTGGTGVHNYPV